MNSHLHEYAADANADTLLRQGAMKAFAILHYKRRNFVNANTALIDSHSTIWQMS